MLKLNASYSKKVPAEGEYTSQSYHASVEVELPDGLSQDQLQNRIHETFEMVRNSVEAELHGNIPNQQGGDTVVTTVNNNQQGYGTAAAKSRETPASPKQIRFLLDLAKGRGVTPAQIAAQHGVAAVEQLSKRQCSDLINSWRVA